MTENIQGTDLTGDRMCEDPRRTRRRQPIFVAPEANEDATDADSLSGEVQERSNDQP